VERCVEMIAATRGERIDLSRIPFDDAPTYEAIQNADTTGVFQIESRAQMQSLRRTRPESLDDLTIQVAIVRPGPIQGGAVNPYIKRRQQMREDNNCAIPYEHPSLEPALADTLGTIIFQDQVIEVAMAFAGFSPGKAEGLRRAMSRKRSQAAMEAYHRDFVGGAQARHGVSTATAERVWDMVKGFSGFGFPKAHGAAFGLLAYQSTWLRVHHAPEFLCALLNEQPMGFYPPDALVHDAQRRGIGVLPPDVNASNAECVVRAGEPSVRIGLGYVNGVKADEVQALVEARAGSGPFRDAADLVSRAGAGRPSLERLAWSGACDAIAGGRRAALWQLGVAAWRPERGRRVRGGVQLALPLQTPAAPELPALSAWDAMIADYSTTGVALANHPIGLLRAQLPAGTASSRDLDSIPHGERVRVAGLVVARQRPGTANGIVFMLLEDEHGTINLIVPPKTYERHRLRVRTEPLLLADGRLERHVAAGGAINVLVDRLEVLAAPDRPVAEVKEFSRLDERERRRIAAEQAAAGEDDPDADAADFRAVAPPALSFGSGRRR
ncbi:MAG: error-prone polymerase, partial [Solirubrobacteraceae bacterium]|nr:error-prone polymerase [Solirubrobacteraceae bacterium]